MPRASTHIFRVRLRARLYRDIEIGSNESLYDPRVLAAVGDAPPQYPDVEEC